MPIKDCPTINYKKTLAFAGLIILAFIMCLTISITALTEKMVDETPTNTIAVGCSSLIPATGFIILMEKTDWFHNNQWENTPSGRQEKEQKKKK